MRKNISKQEFLETIEIYNRGKLSRHEVCSIFSCSTVGLNGLFKKFGIEKIKREHKKRFPFYEEFFSKIDNKYKAYFLGFIMADGCVYIGKSNDHLLRIHIHKKDREIIDEFLRQIKINKKPTYKDNTIEIKVFSKTLINDLINLGCTPRKSFTLDFPKNIPSELLPHFIRGYFDGDGTICYGRRKGTDYYWVKFAVYSSYSFNNGLQKILEENDISCRINNKNKICELVVSGFKNIERIRNYLYADASFSLKRKKEKFIEIASIRNDR